MTDGLISKHRIDTWLREKFTYYVDIEFVESYALMSFNNTSVAEGFAANKTVRIS